VGPPSAGKIEPLWGIIYNIERGSASILSKEFFLRYYIYCANIELHPLTISGNSLIK